ncbi:MAG: hypothetical protein BZY87_02030 [SAR202 cluster bacterium Io17-Chloro-G6]|nr:MAG: hypothetical protein BZY87_02030 [SAR202 cluster bacterium Io17-Chloro-G6]
MRIVLVAAVFAILGISLACSSGVGFVVQLDGDPLRVWDVEELPNIETASNETAPSLNSIINISLSCKVYEDSDYEFIDTCRSVPENAVQWDVEVKGDGPDQIFDFGQSANIFFDLDSDSADLIGPGASNSVMENVTEMIVTLR